MNPSRGTPPLIQWTIQDEPWPLYIAGIKHTKNSAANIHEFIGGEALCTYWKTHGQLPRYATPNVDWDAMDSAMRNSPKSRR